jgi:lipopolysaccharide export system protein LptC
MYGRSAIWFLVLLLAMLAALTMWADIAVQPPGPKSDGSSRHDPDYKLSNFHTLKTDPNGNPRYMLAAAEMVHYPDDDSTHLVRPRFTQYSETKPYTQIEGQRGLVTSDGEQVYLMDKVKVVRGATKQKGEMTVLTDFLHITPDSEFARTDRPVTILQAPRTVVHAIGMEYDKKNGILKLSKRVRAHYERPVVKTATRKSQVLKKKPAAKAAPTKKAVTGPSKTRIRRP